MDLKRLQKMLIRHEGWVNKLYRCPTGHQTIGVGHNIEARPLPKAMADFVAKHGFLKDGDIQILFDSDLEDFTADAARVVGTAWATLDEVRQAAIIDMVFNMGDGGLAKFKNFLAAVKSGDWPKAASEMKNSLWHKQVGNRAIELENMMLSGKWAE